MTKEETFAERILQFNDELANTLLELPDGYKVINPFNGAQKKLVSAIAAMYYQKYYNDYHSRRLILGSSPARRGSAVTGIPFEDAKFLQNETGIFLENFYINQSSSGFLYDVIREYGGREKFYTDFYMNFVCPLGIVKTNALAKEVNCNYYDSEKLKKSLYSFIVNAIHGLIELGIDTSVCFCIGSGENYNYLTKINKEYNFFATIIPLEHPRFIMQYNLKQKDRFLKKYLDALCNHSKCSNTI